MYVIDSINARYINFDNTYIESFDISSPYFTSPSAVAVTANGTAVYIADRVSHVVWLVNCNGKV